MRQMPWCGLAAGRTERNDQLNGYLFSDFLPEIQVAPVPEDIIARPYQLEAIEAAFREWKEVPSTLIVLPTGTGKSVVFAKILKRWLQEHMGRVMIIAHRKELIFQAKAHAEAAGAKCEVEMAASTASKSAQVVAASIQTLNAGAKCFRCEGINKEECETCDGVGKLKRMTKFDPRDFGLIITDEGHHATSDSYMDVYTWFASNLDNKRLFVTATPERSDGKGLHNVCETVAYQMDLREAVEEGWLCPIRQQFVEVEGLDLSKVSTRQGDLADGELERAFIGEDDEEQEAMLHAVAKPVLEISDGKQFIVFTSGVKHAELLQAAFNAYSEADDSIKVETILGHTDPTKRAEIVERLKDGRTQGLVNCGVATEGFDCPAVSVVAIARPTKSTSLYMQMIGRGTRPLPGVVDGPETAEERREAIANSEKQVCTVLDFVGNAGNHKLVSVADVLAGEDVDERDLAEAIRLARSSQSAEDMEALVEKAKEAREAAERAEAERKRLLTRRKADRADYRTFDVDLFDGDNFDASRDYSPPNAHAATEKQVDYMVKCLGVNPDVAMSLSKNQARGVIDQKRRQTGADYIVTFGKYKRRKLSQIPDSWMRWAMENLQNRPEVIQNILEYRNSQYA
jgi:superfamily II DNA or RNA helicase